MLIALELVILIALELVHPFIGDFALAWKAIYYAAIIEAVTLADWRYL